MNPSSPHFLFDPESIGWLHRKHQRGEIILPEDVIRIAKADRTSFQDPIMQDYLLRAAEGKLKRPRGRPPRTLAEKVRVGFAAELVDMVREDLREERKLAGVKGGGVLVEPCVEAAERVGKALKLPRGRSLLNVISSQKTGNIKKKASSPDK